MRAHTHGEGGGEGLGTPPTASQYNLFDSEKLQVFLMLLN